MNKLQKALGINAIFSGTSGLGLILFHNTIANIFEVVNSSIFWIIGAGLILFATTIVYEIRKQRLLAILWIIIQDFIWVVGSAILLFIQPFNISSTGNNMIMTVALVVFFMAINQYYALAQTDNLEKGRKQLKFKRTINASKSAVWKVISDVANYHQVAPNIDGVTIISGKDEGMVRSCSHGKDSWTETCSVWEEEKTYSFIVNTNTPDYPYPLSFLQGTWNVIEKDKNHTEIEMIFELKYKKKIITLFHPILKTKFNQISDGLLDNWKKILENK